MTPLFTLGSLSVTPYSLMMFAGALAGVLICIRQKEVHPLLAPVIAGALIFGHLFWVPFQMDVAESTSLWLSAVSLWQGGYCLYGALFGGLLCAWIGARVTKTDPVTAMDAMAPGACAALFFGRLGEVFSGQGFGNIVESESLYFFPLAYITWQEEDYQEWAYAVWFWEAVTALAILIFLVYLGRRAVRGERTVLFLTLLSVTQILLEQMRKDNYVRITTFIRFTQVAAMATLLVLLIVLLMRRKAGRAGVCLSLGVLVAGALTVIFAEFVFDKPWFWLWLCLSLAACSILCAVHLALYQGREAVISSVLLSLITLILILLHILSPEEQNAPVLYAMMALALTAIGITVTRYAPGHLLSAGRK